MKGSTPQILIVEDERNLGVTLNEYLNSKNYQSHLAQNAQEAKEIFHSEHAPSIVLMDIGLPDGDGIELAKEFRSQKKDLVLLFLSAQNDPDTRVRGLELGAYDYITKPFNLKELTLRLDRIMFTHSQIQKLDDEIQMGDSTVWFKQYEMQNSTGEKIELGQKECAILKILYERKNEAVPRDEIIDNVWGENKYPSNRTVDNYIVRLRKSFEKEAAVEIISIRSIGYKLAIKEL